MPPGLSSVIASVCERITTENMSATISRLLMGTERLCCLCTHSSIIVPDQATMSDFQYVLLCI